jgi:capsular polysaccharide export protein
MSDNYLSNLNIEDAIKYYQVFLLINNDKAIYGLTKLTTIGNLKFDFQAEKEINSFVRLINHNTPNVVNVNNVNSNLNFLENIALAIKFKPSTIEPYLSGIKEIFDYVETKKWSNVFSSMLLLDNDYTINKAFAFLSLANYKKATEISEQLYTINYNLVAFAVCYSQVLSYDNQVQKALKVINHSRNNQETLANITEHLRLCILKGDYDHGLKILQEAESKNFDVSEMIKRKIYFGSLKIQEGFETFIRIGLVKAIKTLYKDKYYVDYTNNPENIVLLVFWGPGDEINFAAIYNLLKIHLGCKNFSICCDIRLYPLFFRSFPEINFIPFKRVVQRVEKYEVSNYNEIPNSSLVKIMDNKVLKIIDQADKIMVVTDMLHKCLPNYKSFPSTPYLKANDIKISEYLNKLAKYKNKLVGLSWRSSVMAIARNQNYFTIEQFEPIFQIDGIQFVNFQSDECAEELEWVEKHYPNKIINFTEIDQYNDFDSVAALMKCMDLIIAPCTVVCALAGALGCNTWLLSNSSELHWRKINNQGVDVWYNSTIHVEGKVLGDKSSVIEELVKKLKKYVDKSVYSN